MELGSQGLKEGSILKKQHRKQMCTSVKTLRSAQLNIGGYPTCSCMQRKCRQVLYRPSIALLAFISYTVNFASLDLHNFRVRRKSRRNKSCRNMCHMFLTQGLNKTKNASFHFSSRLSMFLESADALWYLSKIALGLYTLYSSSLS